MHYWQYSIDSTFGKTIEDFRKKINFRLANNAEEYKKCVSKLNFVPQKKFRKTFVVIHEIKPA